MSRSFARSAAFLFALSFTCLAEDAVKADARYPFRTDFANAHLPWYAPKPLEFPPHHSDRRISGELVAADFIHRTGQFRMSKTGELADFTMPPYGAINYLNAEADLRDVPMGTFFLFFPEPGCARKFHAAGDDAGSVFDGCGTRLHLPAR